MKRLIIIFGIMVCTSAHAEMAENSKKLEMLRILAIENASRQKEIKYLEAFPATFKTFYFTFYGNECCGELYDKTNEHLEFLETLSKKYPEKVLQLWLNIATDGYWVADAVGLLQDQIINYAEVETKSFALALMQLPPKKRLSIVRFLADVENHYYYNEYRNVSKELKVLGFQSLHKDFVTEKERRMKIDHH